MTIALAIRVFDGIVLGADSASTLSGPIDASGTPGVYNVYNNAAKIFNLYKGLPIGGLTWGQGNIGAASISTLAKDFRQRLMGTGEWGIDASNYKISEIAQKAHKFFIDELYTPMFADAQEKPYFGFLVVGYNSGTSTAEEWLVETSQSEPLPLRVNHGPGMNWFAQPEAISRLMLGISPLTPNVLRNIGVPEEAIIPLVDDLKKNLQVTLAPEFMPIQDAIDLANFLIDTTIKFERFSPGQATVGGPVEVASITKHEGFKWIQRKYFYDAKVNP